MPLFKYLYYFLLNTAPGPIANLLVDPQSSSSDVLIQWSPPLEMNGVLLGYLVTVGEFGGPNATMSLHNLNVKDTNITVTSHGLGEEWSTSSKCSKPCMLFMAPLV